jgi:hypothetical protein
MPNGEKSFSTLEPEKPRNPEPGRVRQHAGRVQRALRGHLQSPQHKVEGVHHPGTKFTKLFSLELTSGRNKLKFCQWQPFPALPEACPRAYHLNGA